MKKSFVIHTDSLSILDDLTDEQAGQLFKAIKSYHEGEDSDLDTIIRIAFNPFRNQFQRDQEKYLNRVEVNRANGSKGGKKKVANASKRKPKVAILADSDSDSVSDNDKEEIYRSFDHLSITLKDYSKLVETWEASDVSRILDSIQNYKENKKYKSLYLTARNWLQTTPRKKVDVKEIKHWNNQ